MQENQCRRCRKDINEKELFCNDCHYPGIEDTYNEYRSLIDEGHRRVQAAVMSGWEDPVEAGVYEE